MASDFGRSLATYLFNLRFAIPLPSGFEVLTPYSNAEVQSVVQVFCDRYYGGSHMRLGVWGINPGRFGAGITGLSFTDPVSLKNQLGIESSITGRQEISAEFISMVIEAYGGPGKFYHDVYLGALSPLGFVRDGKNINFYDDVQLSKDIVPFITSSVNTITGFGLNRKAAILLGSGALQKYTRQYLSATFREMKVIALDHPRFVMQYRRAHVSEYVKRYVEAITLYS